jgi:hypothetical protein
MIGDGEKRLTLNAAACLVPNRSGGQGVDPATLWRWALKGLKGQLLETRMIGGIRFTSAEALDRFFDAVTAASDPRIPRRPARQNEADLAAKEAKLAAMGV